MAEFLGVPVAIPENDPHTLEYLENAAKGRLTMESCSDCNTMRYPPGPMCPHCRSTESEWQEVSGKGTIHSYQMVMQPIHPAYRDRAPYPIVLIELDEQRGVPDAGAALRLVGSLVDANGDSESEEATAIGARVEVEMADLGDGLALPRWRLSDEPPEHETWQMPSR